MHLTYNEGKSVADIKILKKKTYKHMAAVSENVYFDVLNYIDDKYNNTPHRTIGMLNLILMLNTVLILMKNILNLK